MIPMEGTALRFPRGNGCRLATDGDRGLFHKLWSEFLAESEKAGGEILATTENLGIYTLLFKAYVTEKTKPGVVVIHDNDAVLMWGQNLNPFETIWGNYFQGWGTYVAPQSRGRGISTHMRVLAADQCKNLGAEFIIGGIAPENSPSRNGFVNMGARKVPVDLFVLELSSC